MKKLKKILFIILKVIIGLYLVICIIFLLFQEKLIFIPEKLSVDYVFNFNKDFEEISIEVEEDIVLNGAIFKSQEPRGLVFYLHGNGGSLRTWERASKPYTDSDYDLFIIDYRGYGKSDGKIKSQKQLYLDMQTAYQEMCKRYNEEDIIVLGYSLGTGIAAKIASTNKPKSLILLAPYYNLHWALRQLYPYLPGFLLRYNLKTNIYIKDCEMPIYLVHGNKDQLFNYKASVKLNLVNPEWSKLKILDGLGHQDLANDTIFVEEIMSILNNAE
jgi:pimeloyl-ACP methyl ester carboxylesterase